MSSGPPDRITSAVGAVFTVRLPSTASTGHQWAVQSFPEDLRLLGSETEVGAEGARPGGPSVQVFRFDSTKAGEYTITFALRRPWETEVVRTQGIHITIR